MLRFIQDSGSTRLINKIQYCYPIIFIQREIMYNDVFSFYIGRTSTKIRIHRRNSRSRYSGWLHLANA